MSVDSSSTIPANEPLPTYQDVIQLKKEERRLQREREKFIVHLVTMLDSWVSLSMQYNLTVSCVEKDIMSSKSN
jgi:hypothetical protein